MNSVDKAGKRAGGRVTGQRTGASVSTLMMDATTEAQPRRALYSVHDGHNQKALRKEPQGWACALDGSP